MRVDIHVESLAVAVLRLSLYRKYWLFFVTEIDSEVQQKFKFTL